MAVIWSWTVVFFFPGKMTSYRNMVTPNQLGVLCLGSWENWLRQILCLERSLLYPLSRLHACEPWSIKGNPLFTKILVDSCSFFFFFAINVKKMCVPIMFWCFPNGIRHTSRLNISFTEIIALYDHKQADVSKSWLFHCVFLEGWSPYVPDC